MYQFYLDGVLLPVTPGSLDIKVANQNKTITLINEGEVNILKSPGLSKISFEALLPNQRYSFSQYGSGYQGAQYYLSHLERLKTGCKPFPFYIIRTNDSGTVLMQSQQMSVSLEEYTLKEDAEKYGTDVLVSIELKQYREYGTKTLEFKQPEQQSQGEQKSAVVTEQRDTSTKKTETTYTVKSGDNLWSIAKIKLGNGSRSNEIYELNKEVIEAAAKKYGRSSSSNGWWIYPGTELKLPS